jgi:NAD(P) transhydrogenase subunit alpha
MGVGVRGLQAIATARRSARRSARPTFVPRPGADPVARRQADLRRRRGRDRGRRQGGYASETSAEYQAAQAELVSGHIAKQDIVITTALIPGGPHAADQRCQLATMRPGSVIVDLAAEAGGNVEGASPARPSSGMGARSSARCNCPNAGRRCVRAVRAQPGEFPDAFWDKERVAPVLPDDDEIVAAIRLTRAAQWSRATQDGAITNRDSSRLGDGSGARS